MIRHLRIHGGLEIAGWADFEVNVLLAKGRDESIVLDTSDTVTDASRLQETESFPDAVRTASFSGMSGSMQSMLPSEVIGVEVGGDGESGFASGKVEGDNVRPSKPLYQSYGLITLLGSEVAQSAEDEASLNAGVSSLRCYLVVHDLDNCFGGESAGQMKERRETDLAVDNVVCVELPEQVGGYETEGLLILHESETPWSTSEEVGEVGAATGRDELFPVTLGRDGRLQRANNIVAETAVEMDVEFDLGEHGSIVAEQVRGAQEDARIEPAQIISRKEKDRRRTAVPCVPGTN
jgi:hypothetical protein